MSLFYTDVPETVSAVPGRIKLFFPLSHPSSSPEEPPSHRKHREIDVCQRRFWAHRIDKEDFPGEQLKNLCKFVDVDGVCRDP